MPGAETGVLDWQAEMRRIYWVNMIRRRDRTGITVLHNDMCLLHRHGIRVVSAVFYSRSS